VAVVSDFRTPQSATLAWFYFRKWYLAPSTSFHKSFIASPPFHYQIWHDLVAYDYNVLAAPRGSAKSTVVGTEMPLMILCTRPHSTTTLCLATDAMVRERFDLIMEQIASNKFIEADFGTLKTGRNKGVWSNHYLRLANGAKLKGFGVGGRKRGARPDLFILDDPEFDAASPETMGKIRGEFSQMMFQVILPMLEEGSKLFWIGTMINRRTLIYSAFYGEDPRFKYWNRRILAAGARNGDGFTKLLWPEKWSEKFLLRRQGEMGSAAFSAEYLNDPVSEQSRLFYIDRTKNQYLIEGKVPHYPFDDTESKIIAFKYGKLKEDGGEVVQNGVPRKWGSISVNEPYARWLRSLYRVILVDYAKSVTPTSDSSAVITVGFDVDNVMWVLDAWVGKQIGDALINTIMKYGLKWLPHAVCPEAVTIQRQMAENAAAAIYGQAGATGWVPRVLPPKYPSNMPKADRIIFALERRLRRGNLKLPINPENNGELYDNVSCNSLRILENQMQDFTPDLALLPHDDAIDCLSIAGFISYRRGVPLEDDEKVETAKELILKGELYWPGTGLPLIDAIPTQQLTEEILAILEERVYRRLRMSQFNRGRMPTAFDRQRHTLMRGL